MTIDTLWKVVADRNCAFYKVADRLKWRFLQSDRLKLCVWIKCVYCEMRQPLWLQQTFPKQYHVCVLFWNPNQQISNCAFWKSSLIHLCDYVFGMWQSSWLKIRNHGLRFWKSATNILKAIINGVFFMFLRSDIVNKTIVINCIYWINRSSGNPLIHVSSVKNLAPLNVCLFSMFREALLGW